MKKLILTIMMLASFQSFAGTVEKQSTTRGQDGGGGGVIYRDGIYLTFNSAKIKVGAPLLEEIPGMDLLLAVLDNNQKSLSSAVHGELISAIVPSESRRYFKIDQSQLENGTYQRLIAEYAKLLKNQVDPNNLALAAIHIKEDTFLLPPFFQLKQSEQAAILFHESLWIVKPDIEYDQLVRAEMTMQRHIEKFGTQTVFSLDLLTAIGFVAGNYSDIVYAAVIQDAENGLFKKYKFPTEKLWNYVDKTIYIGGDYDKPKSTSQSAYVLNLFSQTSGSILISEVREAMKQYPELQFLKAMYAFRNQIKSLKIKYVLTNTQLLRKNYSIEKDNWDRESCLTGRMSDNLGEALYVRGINGSKDNEDIKICIKL